MKNTVDRNVMKQVTKSLERNSTRRHKVQGWSVIAVTQYEQNKDHHACLEYLGGRVSTLCEVHGDRDLGI